MKSASFLTVLAIGVSAAAPAGTNAPRASASGRVNAAPTAQASPQQIAISKIDRMIETIRRNKPAKTRAGVHEETFALTEDEVNAYIDHWIRDQGRSGKVKEVTVKAGAVQLEPDHIIKAQALVQFGVGSLKFLGSESESALAQVLKRYLAVDNSASLACLVSSAKGKVYVKIVDAKIKGVTIPDSWIQSILEAVGKHQRPPLDMTRPFNLPNGITKIEVLPHLLKIHLEAARPR